MQSFVTEPASRLEGGLSEFLQPSGEIDYRELTQKDPASKRRSLENDVM
jgi:hypothetical protein